MLRKGPLRRAFLRWGWGRVSGKPRSAFPSTSRKTWSEKALLGAEEGVCGLKPPFSALIRPERGREGRIETGISRKWTKSPLLGFSMRACGRKRHSSASAPVTPYMRTRCRLSRSPTRAARRCGSPPHAPRRSSLVHPRRSSARRSGSILRSRAARPPPRAARI